MVTEVAGEVVGAGGPTGERGARGDGGAEGENWGDAWWERERERERCVGGRGLGGRLTEQK